MTVQRALLPPNASHLERAVAAIALPAELEALADLPTGVSYDLPPGFAPLIAAQFFLAQFAHHFNTAEQLLVAGLPWLRERGTAAAVIRALAWIAIDAQVEEDGALLHLDPGSPRAPARLGDIRQLIEASIPAHVRFYRLFHGYDLRHARADRSRGDDSIWDNDSGIVIDGLRVSFGERVADATLAPARGVLTWSTAAHAVTLRRDSMYWDGWTLDGDWQIDLFGGVGQAVFVEIASRDLGQPLFAPGQFVIEIVARDEAPLVQATTAESFTEVETRQPRRKWIGPWAGKWRLTIPFKASEE
ncbi:MAG: phage tail protein [Pseudomonas sp.]|uniref:phage tail protein n=1 Tax=Pseudomonas sp. TaxID=306 RepID=UPI003397897D